MLLHARDSCCTSLQLVEMITWQQLGLHTKPVGLLNMKGYFDHLLDFFDHAVQEARRLPLHPLP